MGNFSLLLLAKLMDWPFSFVITISYLAWFKACLHSALFPFSLPRLSLFLRMGLQSLKQVLYFCLPSLWNVIATEDNLTLL